MSFAFESLVAESTGPVPALVTKRADVKIKTALHSRWLASNTVSARRAPDVLAKLIFCRFREVGCLMYCLAVKVCARAFQVVGDTWRLAIKRLEVVRVVSR
jgi:hypothetical protein